jgi:hypothetical protein
VASGLVKMSGKRCLGLRILPRESSRVRHVVRQVLLGFRSISVGPWGDQPGASPGYGLILVAIAGGPHPLSVALQRLHSPGDSSSPSNPIPSPAPQPGLPTLFQGCASPYQPPCSMHEAPGRGAAVSLLHHRASCTPGLWPHHTLS